MNTLLDIVNQALLYGIESTNDHLAKAAVYLSHKGERDKLCQLLKDACGEDYSNYIKSTKHLIFIQCQLKVPAILS